MLFKDATNLALAEMREELSPTSLPTWQCHARKALAYWGPERDLTTVTRLEVQGWINSRAKEVKASTIGHERAFLSRLWRVLEDRGLDTGLQCPLLRLRMPKKKTDKRQISGEVVTLLEDLLEPEDVDLVRFTLLTYLRRLEVFRLRPDHISTWPDEAQPGRHLGKVRVITSKTGRPRTVPLNHGAADIARRRVDAAHQLGHAYLFGDQGEDRFAAACGWAKRVWYPTVKVIGKGGHFHGLRHRVAHLAWANGAPIEATSKMLGHSNIPQTEHYIGVTEEVAWASAHATGRGAIDPPPIPRPDLVDPMPTAPLPTPPMQPAPAREPGRKKASDWIFSM